MRAAELQIISKTAAFSNGKMRLDLLIDNLFYHFGFLQPLSNVLGWFGMLHLCFFAGG